MELEGQSREEMGGEERKEKERACVNEPVVRSVSNFCLILLH